ncbi:MAG TPA: hypothetical protein VIU29_05520, partial [Candidatus Deferrimicrobiaceae bacterium]
MHAVLSTVDSPRWFLSPDYIQIVNPGRDFVIQSVPKRPRRDREEDFRDAGDPKRSLDRARGGAGPVVR